MKRRAIVILLFLPVWLAGQTPFLNTAQVFAALPSELAAFSVHPTYLTSDVLPIGTVPPDLDAIGFRKTDNFLYGILRQTNHLQRIGQNAAIQDLGPIGLDNTLSYLAGDVSPDGEFLFSIGSDVNGKDIHLAKTDLSWGGTTQFILLTGIPRHLVDIAFDPFSGSLYGYDDMNHCFVTVNPVSGAVISFPPISYENNIFGLYFDPFGDLYGVGNAVYGIVSAHFKVNKSNGIAKLLATGPPFVLHDIASCPYAVALKNTASPEIILPCSEVTITYNLANGTDETFANLNFVHPLPTGFHLSGVLQNSFGALVDTMTIPGSILVENMSVSPGLNALQLKMHTDDLPAGTYRSQAKLTDLSAFYGATVLSDNPSSPGFLDSSQVKINRFEEDSLSFNWLICHGETLNLSATEYGGTVKWSNGLIGPELSVTQGANYFFKAGNTCEEIFVNHAVTSATCPFTIALSLMFIPDTSFACSELTLRYILRNDSGEPRFNLSITDTLPDGFSFIDFIKDPFGVDLEPGNPPNIITFGGINILPGQDTIDLRIKLGDIPPGKYSNRALLFGLPVVMGPIRLSDDPSTFTFDSTSLWIKGAQSDSVFLEEKVCRNTEITLDASDLGKNYLWDNGSTEAQLSVNTPGEYHLVLFDGCEPADVFWTVIEGSRIQISPIGPFQIHQGQSLDLALSIQNQGDSLGLLWNDPLGNSLSCLNCPNPVAIPLENVIYSAIASNAECSDSIAIQVEVDINRRLYAPNAFSPNDDGDNDYFFLQCPDVAALRFLQIFDRWGNLVFQSTSTDFTATSSRWDGRYRNRDLDEGVYIWQAKVEFADGSIRLYDGDLTLFR